MAPRKIQSSIALPYRLFFLYIEPFFALIGAYHALFLPTAYLALTHAPSAPRYGIPTSTSIILTQLANLYAFFAINEALVLRAAGNDIRVWRAVIVALLIADAGHLYSVKGLGTRVYWDVRGWNAIDWGNVGFVYMGALTRVCFLARPEGWDVRGSMARAREKLRWRRGGSGMDDEPTTPRRSSRRVKPSAKVKS